MRLLFERLEDLRTEPPPPLPDLLTRSVDQLMASHTLCEADAPPGILNFGLPRAVDVAPGEAGGKAYAALLARRIAEFEPRLRQPRVVFDRGAVEITALYGPDDELRLSWPVR